MGRLTEWIAYLNADDKDKNIEKRFTHLSITDKLALIKYKMKKKQPLNKGDL